MYFEQNLDERCGCAFYSVVSRRSRVVIVDPLIETERYEELLRERDFRLALRSR
jgi:hypothetical protein